ncbi:lysophospholipid acyltransferase family protein [Deferrisoma sp.]
MTDRLRPILFPLVIALLTLVLGSAAVVAGYTDRRRRWCRHLAPLWCRLLLRVAGVEVRVIHPERLPPAGAVFVANHQSNLDILALGDVLPHNVLWLAKRELFRIPVFGRAMAALGYIPVDRGDSEKARASVDEAARRVREGEPVILFPEGTRSRDGRLLPFKLGFVHLAAASGAPVVPLVLRNTADLCPKGSWTVRPGTVEIEVLEPYRIGRIDTPEARRAEAGRLREAMAARLEAA